MRKKIHSLVLVLLIACTSQKSIQDNKPLVVEKCVVKTINGRNVTFHNKKGKWKIKKNAILPTKNDTMLLVKSTKIKPTIKLKKSTK